VQKDEDMDMSGSQYKHLELFINRGAVVKPPDDSAAPHPLNVKGK
jgi:hypothetical protein